MTKFVEAGAATINKKGELHMKIAVTSKGMDLDSQVDPRFGRAAYILLVDSETYEYDTLDNHENVNSFKGAGIKAATMISDKGADVLLTGFCGPNAMKTLNTADIKVVVEVGGSIRTALEAFNMGEFTPTGTPNAEGHWV